MQFDATQPDDETQPTPSLPPVDGERRKEDRRQTDRQGKYDRRKNRCVHCLHFKENEVVGTGQCLKHGVEMASYAFACPQFSPALPDPRKI